MAEHSVEHVQYHRNEVERLKGVVTLTQLNEDVAVLFRRDKYTLKLCNYSFQLLFAFLHDKKLIGLLRIINEHVDIKSEWLSRRSREQHQENQKHSSRACWSSF